MSVNVHRDAEYGKGMLCGSRVVKTSEIGSLLIRTVASCYICSPLAFASPPVVVPLIPLLLSVLIDVVLSVLPQRPSTQSLGKELTEMIGI